MMISYLSITIEGAHAHVLFEHMWILFYYILILRIQMRVIVSLGVYKVGDTLLVIMRLLG